MQVENDHSLEHASTPMILIDAAERLFGEHGIEGVSLRRINAEAGVNHKSAIAYYFGNRWDLVRAIWQDRSKKVEKRRETLLAETEAQGLSHDPATMLHILYSSMQDLVDAAGRRRYASFYRHALASPELRAERRRIVDSGGVTSRLLSGLLRCSPLDDQEIFLRIRMVTLSFCDMLVEQDNMIASGNPGFLRDVDLVDTASDMTLRSCHMSF